MVSMVSTCFSFRILVLVTIIPTAAWDWLPALGRLLNLSFWGLHVLLHLRWLRLSPLSQCPQLFIPIAVVVRFAFAVVVGALLTCSNCHHHAHSCYTYCCCDSCCCGSHWSLYGVWGAGCHNVAWSRPAAFLFLVLWSWVRVNAMQMDFLPDAALGLFWAKVCGRASEGWTYTSKVQNLSTSQLDVLEM